MLFKKLEQFDLLEHTYTYHPNAGIDDQQTRHANPSWLSRERWKLAHRDLELNEIVDLTLPHAFLRN